MHTTFLKNAASMCRLKAIPAGAAKGDPAKSPPRVTGLAGCNPSAQPFFEGLHSSNTFLLPVSVCAGTLRKLIYIKPFAPKVLSENGNPW